MGTTAVMTTKATTIIADFKVIRDGLVLGNMDEADGPLDIGDTVIAQDAETGTKCIAIVLVIDWSNVWLRVNF